MPVKKSYLTQIFATPTKVKILKQFVLDPTSLTRHALSKTISSGIGPAYKQVDQLIALGVLEEEKGLISLDISSPFYDDICSIVTSTSNYMDDPRILLDRIDVLFGNDYYITGYLAARQNGTPVDHDQDSALVAILDANNRSTNFLGTLAAVSPAELRWFETNSIPDDIKRLNIYGTNIWIASIERGLVDSFIHGDCPLYAIMLLLLQNIIEENINTSKLLRIAEEKNVHKIFVVAISELNDAAGKIILPLKSKTIYDAKKQQSDPISVELKDTAKKAYNTLMSG